MAEVFDKISMYMEEAVREAETRVSFTFQWWHWLLVSITVVAVLTFLVLIIYCCLLKRKVTRQTNNNSIFHLVRKRRYVKENHISTNPIGRTSKSTESEFTNLSDDESTYAMLTFQSMDLLIMWLIIISLINIIKNKLSCSTKINFSCKMLKFEVF